MFDVQVRSLGRAAVVAVAGEVDVATADRLAEVLDDARQRHPELLVVDLTGVTFLDSTGLKALLDGSAQAAADGSRLVVAGVRPTIHRVLTITGVAARLDACRQGEPWPWPEVSAPTEPAG